MASDGDTSLNILVVDDHPEICELLELFLLKRGHAVKSCGDIMAAMEETSMSRFDVVITDVNLPGGSGVELLRQIRAKSPTTYTVIITGKPSVAAAVDCIQMGAEDYLSKPIDFSRLTACLDDVGKARSRPEADKRFIADYEVIRAIGEGGMGVVFECVKDNTRYAVKILHELYLNGDHADEFLERIKREADIISRLRHPNVVTIHDFGLWSSGGHPYLVMEYLDGVTLEVLRHRREIELSLEWIADIGRQVASALEAIHGLKVLHRDIKPSNIMVLEDDVAKVLDFGMARVPESDLTLSNALVGTPKYMAPELLCSPRADGRADIYSLGATLFELFLGQAPLEADGLSAMFDVLSDGEPLSPQSLKPDFPEALTRILSATLAKSPHRRYPRAAYLQSDLEAWLRNPQVAVSDLACSAFPSLWD